MSETPSKRQMLDCSPDPCAYDHTCRNHRLLAEVEQSLTNAQARCAEAEKDKARYRWLRGMRIFPEDLDEAADAALKAPR